MSMSPRTGSLRDVFSGAGVAWCVGGMRLPPAEPFRHRKLTFDTWVLLEIMALRPGRIGKYDLLKPPSRRQKGPHLTPFGPGGIDWTRAKSEAPLLSMPGTMGANDYVTKAPVDFSLWLGPTVEAIPRSAAAERLETGPRGGRTRTGRKGF